MDAAVFAFLAAISLAPASCSASRRRCTCRRPNVNEVLKEGGRTGMRRHPRPALDGRAHRRRARADARAAGRRGLHDAQLHDAVPAGYRRRHLAPADGRCLHCPIAKYPAPSNATRSTGRWTTGCNAIGAVRSRHHRERNLPAVAAAGRTLVDRRPAASGRAQPPMSRLISIGPRYFDTIGVRIIRGRPLNDTDGPPARTTSSSTSGSRRCTSRAKIPSAGASASPTGQPRDRRRPPG